MPRSRCYSAPPVDKFIIDGDIEFGEIQREISYSIYYRKNKDPRLAPPKFIFDGQGSIWASEHNDFLVWAFSEQRTAVEMIDLDHPDTESCSEFSGRSKTTTPVGDKPNICPEMLTNPNNSILIPISVSPVQKTENSPIISELRAFYCTLGREVPHDMVAICVLLCKDQEGSRFIQNKLDVWSQEQISHFFLKIYDSAYELSTNLFGNYVIQKIIPLLREDEVFKLILQFFGQVHELSLHIYGCRVVQKLIDNLDDIKFAVAEIESHIMELIESPNGNHVIQKCIDKDIDKGFILREFEKNGMALAQERYGCRVLQRLFEVCSEEETAKIYDIIVSGIDKLINDKYGNYVIQHLILFDRRSHKQIFEYIIKNAYELSKYKFSSNVIEKCVDSASVNQLEEFLEVFLITDKEGKSNLFYMCTDMYANYVVQRIFDVAPPSLRERAKAALVPYIKEMRVIPFTKHILARLL